MEGSLQLILERYVRLDRAFVWRTCALRMGRYNGDQNTPNGQLVPSYWWEYICAPEYMCYDIVVDMVRYESYDMCVDERRDWHALGESWKSIFQQAMENRNTYFSRLWKTGIQVPTKCSGKELSQSGVCDDVFLSGYYVNGKRFTCAQRKLSCLGFRVRKTMKS